MVNEINVSISEINQFLKCRRAWDYSSHTRQSLRHKTTPRVFFVIGSGLHEAIEANAKGLDPHEAVATYIDHEREEKIAYYREVTNSSPWSSELKDFEESADLCKALVTQYFDHYGYANPLESEGLKYIGVEISFKVPVVEHSGTLVNLIGTIDGIATDIHTESKLFLLENKTASRKPDINLVRKSNQFVGYNWIFRELTGVTPSGTLYNGIIKRLIKPPKTLKSGALSQDKSASVTYRSFMDALNAGGHDPEKYLDYMTFLYDRERYGDERFFYRPPLLTYSNYRLDQWGQSLQSTVKDMLNPQIYPNFTSCDGCFFTDLCDAQEEGEDVQQVVDLRYTQGSYGTVDVIRTTPESEIGQCATPTELVAHLSGGLHVGA